MDRRAFLTGAAALALAFTPGEAEARPRRPGEPFEAWLERLSSDLGRMRARRPIASLREGFVVVGLPEALPGEALATLSLLAAWQRCPVEEQRHPAFTRLMLRGLRDLPARSLQVLEWLERLPRERLRRLGRLLRRPSRLLALLERVFIRRGQSASPRRRQALRRALGDLAATLRRRTLPELVAALGADFDAVVAAEGFDRARIRASGDAPAASAEDEEEQAEGFPTPAMKVAARLASLGLAVELGSLLTFFLVGEVSGILGTIAAVGCLYVGPLLLLLGLIIGVIAVVVWMAKTRDDEESQALSALLGPEEVAALAAPG
ncbi:MAG: hypothetical protein H6739_32100 [Alphaproteobacteria bacterium]|nr:hypothetical protein [Alphaproteobacteria bacterium]